MLSFIIIDKNQQTEMSQLEKDWKILKQHILFPKRNIPTLSLCLNS